MAAVSLGEPKAGKGKKGVKKVKKKKRIPVRIDMTPMVDVVMLLITFFMLTTVFNTPQTMEINLPPSESKVEVAESSLLTLRLIEDGKIFWNLGIEVPSLIDVKSLHNLLVERLKANEKLITLVKVDRSSTYEMMVDIMDELNLANINRFSIAPFNQNDRVMVQKAMVPAL